MFKTTLAIFGLVFSSEAKKMRKTEVGVFKSNEFSTSYLADENTEWFLANMRNYTAHRAEIPELRKAAGMDKGARLMLKNGTCLGDIDDYRCFKDRRPEPQDFALFVRWELEK